VFWFIVHFTQKLFETIQQNSFSESNSIKIQKIRMG